MGRPVIVDDGGSIRIKLTDGDGEMDGLIQPQRKHDITPHPSHYTKGLIVWVMDDGEPKTKDIDPFDEVLISTDLGLGVVVKKQGVKLRVEVTSSTLEPMIESKSIKNKRNYTFLNGGRINKVEYPNNPAVNIPVEAVYAGVIIS